MISQCINSKFYSFTWINSVFFHLCHYLFFLYVRLIFCGFSNCWSDFSSEQLDYFHYFFKRHVPMVDLNYKSVMSIQFMLVEYFLNDLLWASHHYGIFDAGCFSITVHWKRGAPCPR